MTIIINPLSGAQSSGKTTSINRTYRILTEAGFRVLKTPETARLHKGPIGKAGGFKAQKWMIEKQIELEKEALDTLISEGYHKSTEKAFILCDRCIWDMLVYSISLNRRGVVSDDELIKVEKLVTEYAATDPYTTIFFCEKKPLYDDGVRDTDPAWQDDIYQTFKAVIKDYNIQVVTLQ